MYHNYVHNYEICLQRSLTFTDPIYPDYSLIQTVMFGNQLIFTTTSTNSLTYLEIQLQGRSFRNIGVWISEVALYVYISPKSQTNIIENKLTRQLHSVKS